jgi:flavin reductase (DIM6/NTAB) family NADH-FMN oxidoreductase RutF
MSIDTVPVDPDRYRKVMGRLPTGVVAITGLDEQGQNLGFVVGSFHSLSLDPPIVTFSVATTSSTWPLIRRQQVFTANVLAADQLDECRALAAKGPDKFSTVQHTRGPVGAPRLTGAIAWVDCTVRAEVLVGDHFMVVGTVQAMESAEGEPLLFKGGQYGTYAGLTPVSTTGPR